MNENKILLYKHFLITENSTIHLFLCITKKYRYACTWDEEYARSRCRGSGRLISRKRAGIKTRMAPIIEEILAESIGRDHVLGMLGAESRWKGIIKSGREKWKNGRRLRGIRPWIIQNLDEMFWMSLDADRPWGKSTWINSAAATLLINCSFTQVYVQTKRKGEKLKKKKYIYINEIYK